MSAYEEINMISSLLFWLAELKVSDVQKQANNLKKCYPTDLSLTFYMY